MSALNHVMEAFYIIAEPQHVLWIVFFTIVGILLGAMPGIGQALALAIVFPFTLTMTPELALMSMATLYGASTFGGSISAILVRIPGSPTSMATVLDGYPMTRSGQGAMAMGISASASFCGAIIGLAVLMFLAPALARFSVLLGSAELFMLTLVGFSTVSAVARGSLMKSLASVSLGVLFATVGVDPIVAQPRFTFSTFYLEGGINLIVLLVGLFSIPQVLEMVTMRSISNTGEVEGNTWQGVRHTFSHPFQTFRGGIIGTTVGSIPGVGATAANFISYLTAVNMSDKPEAFGTGEPDGIVAAETANNGSAIGSLIPAMSLAIPGSATAAIFIGVMIAHGITPGPNAFEGPLPYVIYLSIAFSSVLFLFAGIYGSGLFAKVTTLPTDVVLIGIVVFSLTGAFAVRSNVLDVLLAVFIGFFGYFMIRQDYSVVAFVLAFVLTPIAERGFQRALVISDGDYGIFLSTPIGIALFVISFVVLISPFVFHYVRE